MALSRVSVHHKGRSFFYLGPYLVYITRVFLYKNKLYKNTQAEIWLKFFKILKANVWEKLKTTPGSAKIYWFLLKTCV